MSRPTPDGDSPGGWSAPRVVSAAPSAPAAQSPPAGASASPAAAPGRPRRRRSRWRVALIGALCVAVALAAGWVVLFSSVLGARTVEVSGAALLTPDQVRTAAAVPDGSPLARLDTGAVARRVEKLPEVLSATVRVSYPSTVRIAVTERVAVAFQRDGGESVLVDDAGVAFRTVDQPPAGQPELVVSSDAARQATAEVSGALPADLRAQVASIRADTVNAVTLKLGDGRTVLWGAAQDNAAKVRLLTALLGQPGDTFDISASGIVVVR